LSELKKEKDERLEQERIEEEKRQAALAEQRELEAKMAAEKAAERAEKAKKIKKIAVPAAAAIVVLALVLVLFVIPSIKKNNQYNEAMNYYSSGDYEQAKEIFTELGSFKDSEDKLKECDDAIASAENAELYEEIQSYLSTRQYPVDMGEKLEKLGDYKDSAAILAEYNDYIAAAKAMDVSKEPYIGAEAFALGVEHMKNAKYVKFPEGTEQFLDIFVPFLGKWTYSAGDDQLLSYMSKDSSNHKSMKDIELKYTESASTGDATIQVFHGDKALYISLPKFNVQDVKLEQDNYVTGTFIYSLKDDNTLLVEFKGKDGRADGTVEYTRAK
jgi:flagellar basal body-associated protein FliL